MDSLVDGMDTQVVLLVGAIAVFFLLSRLFFRIFSGAAGTILSIVIIVLLLQYAFDISPKELWYEVSHLPQNLARFAKQLA
ncbi:MAG: hypothetical protein DCF25_21575 [Leptolyngbya foveolarum]|uniref:Uncharacterized protein n=1 Tax=Leptolyngbya foveolarum TaxID=47253 RepID=A0A2W4TL31_9CYAN|nr:MAG: hypothetical protein DCF25_21575 [Leptolyngbya foveolarum]